MFDFHNTSQVTEDTNGILHLNGEVVGGLGPEWAFVSGSGQFVENPFPQFLIFNKSNGAIDVGSVVGDQVEYSQVGAVGHEWKYEGLVGHNQFLLHNTITNGNVAAGVFDGHMTYIDWPLS